MSKPIDVQGYLSCTDDDHNPNTVFHVASVLVEKAAGGFDCIQVINYRVMMEREDGSRIIHFALFDEPEPAEALRLKIKNHISKCGKLRPEYWNSIEPAYGSRAWLESDHI